MRWTCMLYKLLYRLVPLRGLQVRIIRGHFEGCAFCREEYAPEEECKQALFAPSQLEHLDPVYPAAGAPAGEKQDIRVLPGVPVVRFPRWGLAAASLAVAAVIGFSLLLFQAKDTPVREQVTGPVVNAPGSGGEPRETFIHYVKARGGKARTYILKDRNSPRTFVWIEPKDRRQT